MGRKYLPHPPINSNAHLRLQFQHPLASAYREAGTNPKAMQIRSGDADFEDREAPLLKNKFETGMLPLQVMGIAVGGCRTGVRRGEVQFICRNFFIT